jgi:hypothetical protein
LTTIFEPNISFYKAISGCENMFWLYLKVLFFCLIWLRGQSLIVETFLSSRN